MILWWWWSCSFFQKQKANLFPLQQNMRENSAWYHSICKPRNISFSATYLHAEFPKVKGYELQSPPCLSPHSPDMLPQHCSSKCSLFATHTESLSSKRKFGKKKIKQKKIFVKDVVFSLKVKWLKQQASRAYSPLSLGHVRLLETLCQLPNPEGTKCQIICKCQHSHSCYNYLLAFLSFFLFSPSHSLAGLFLALSLLAALSSIDSLGASTSSTGTRHREPLQPFQWAQGPLLRATRKETAPNKQKRNSPAHEDEPPNHPPHPASAQSSLQTPGSILSALFEGVEASGLTQHTLFMVRG